MPKSMCYRAVVIVFVKIGLMSVFMEMYEKCKELGSRTEINIFAPRVNMDVKISVYGVAWKVI